MTIGRTETITSAIARSLVIADARFDTIARDVMQHLRVRSPGAAPMA